MIKRSLPGSASRHIAPNRPLRILISESIAIGFAWHATASVSVSWAQESSGCRRDSVHPTFLTLNRERPLRFKLAIFDFDGTLADSLGWFIGISGRLADEFGFDRIDKNQVATLRRHDAATLLRLHHVPLLKLPFIAARFRRLMAGQIDMISLFPGVADLLDRLSQAGFALAIVTSNSYANVRHVLGTKNMGSWRPARGRVHLRQARKAAQGLAAHRHPPAQAILIGDEIRDIEAARDAGIASGAVTWGFTDLDTSRLIRRTCSSRA